MAQSVDDQRPPNVILFLADDMGYRDCGVCGSQFYQTPHIDRLAARGMHFLSAYAAAPQCSPTRASILTGKYPGRLGLTLAVGDEPAERVTGYLPDNAPSDSVRIEPVSANRLVLEHVTLAEAFKSAGYATAHYGKWHVGWAPYGPRAQGFDQALPNGSHPGPPSYFSPYNIASLPDGPAGEHIDERLAEEAVAFIREHQHQPFFLNFWPFSVHAPFQAKPELIEAYRARADASSPQHSPTMGAMLQTLDATLGRLMQAVEELGLERNTLVVFFSDNGGNMYDVVDGTTPTSNHPLRAGKGSVYEGGVRVPLLVAWPGKIPPGAVTEALVSSVDLFPTLLELAGAQASSHVAADGESFAPVLLAESAGVREQVPCHFPHSLFVTGDIAATSIRTGDWKLIRFYADGANQSDRYELYHLPSDIGETTNLAAAYPEHVLRLDGLIDQHLQDTGALVPIANPDYTPSAEP